MPKSSKKSSRADSESQSSKSAIELKKSRYEWDSDVTDSVEIEDLSQEAFAKQFERSCQQIKQSVYSTQGRTAKSSFSGASPSGAASLLA